MCGGGAVKYGITDVAEILGVTTSAVRYFEKEHLINTGKEKNGRRYYNEEDVFRLLSYTKYRAMNIPMKKIIHQFSGSENNWKRILEKEINAREEALKKAEDYRKLAESIERQIERIQLIERLEGKYEFEKSPIMILMQDKGCGWISKDRKAQQSVRQWVAHMPEVCLCTVKKRMEEEADFGYLIPEDSRLKTILPMDLNVRTLPASLCVHTIVKAAEDFAFHPQKIFDAACTYAWNRGFESGGQAWGQILLVEVEEGQKLHTYVELWIPVC